MTPNDVRPAAAALRMIETLSRAAVHSDIRFGPKEHGFYASICRRPTRGERVFSADSLAEALADLCEHIDNTEARSWGEPGADDFAEAADAREFF